MKNRLIVALDVPTVDEAEILTCQLGDAVNFYKVGLELVTSDGGMDFVHFLKMKDKRIFLDMKLHDIGTTVERAASNLALLGVDFITVHGYPQTMDAAMRGVHGSDTKVLAVTVMTSYNDRDLETAGYAKSVAETVRIRANQAKVSGVHGLILAPTDLMAIREEVGPGTLLVTPGIRPASSDQNDQKRSATPGQAITDGADYIVVGRPITRAPNPRQAVEHIVLEMELHDAISQSQD